MRLRQIALIAADLDGATEALCATLGLRVAYRDPGVAKFGLANIVAPVGGEFLEIVSPTEAGTAGGRFLARRGGDSGYMVILHGGDGRAARTRATGLGLRAVQTYDDAGYVATHFHPRDTGGILLSLDSVPGVTDYTERLCDWPPAGPGDWRAMVREERVRGLVGVEMAVAAPADTAALWGRVLARPVTAAGGGWAIALDGATLRFTAVADGRGPGVQAVDLAVADAPAVLAAARARGLAHGPASITLCGTVFNLVGSAPDSEL